MEAPHLCSPSNCRDSFEIAKKRINLLVNFALLYTQQTTLAVYLDKSALVHIIKKVSARPEDGSDTSLRNIGNRLLLRKLCFTYRVRCQVLVATVDCLTRRNIPQKQSFIDNLYFRSQEIFQFLPK